MRCGASRAARAAVTIAALLFAPAAAAAPAGDPWTRGAGWATLRFGAVKSMQENGPDANFGWGIGYRRMLTPRLSVGFGADHNIVGRYSGSSLVEVPLAFESLLHFRWRTPVHPALGAGFAAVYRKAYRSGADFSEVQPAGFVAVALHAPVSTHTVIGGEFRAMSVSSDQSGVNPVFGGHPPSSGRTSFKVTISRAFW